MRFQVSVIFALFSAPFVVCKNEKFHDASNGVVRKEALLEQVPSSFSTPADEDSAPMIETNDPDTNDQLWFHRELQFTDACNASLEELYSDEALNAASIAYEEAYAVASASFANNSSFESCEQTSETVFTCDYSPPIDGEAEYMSACTAAGGEILSLSLDLSCDGAVNETTKTLVIDLPATLKCIPTSPDFASCADTIREGLQNFTDFYAFIAEISLSVGLGISNVSCTAADVGGDTGGSDNGGGDSGGSGTDEGEDGEGEDGEGEDGGSNNDGGESNASTLSLLISFGVMAIISLTLG